MRQGFLCRETRHSWIAQPGKLRIGRDNAGYAEAICPLHKQLPRSWLLQGGEYIGRRKVRQTESEESKMILTLFLLSLFGGFFSGLVGVGGAVVLIPLMLAVPPIVGVGNLAMNQVSGINMVQVLTASATGFLAHRSKGFIHTRSILTIGIPMGAFSFEGAAISKTMTSQDVLLIFGFLVALAFMM